MQLLLSDQDQEFKIQVESCKFPAADFDHRAHLRLAYIYLANNNPSIAVSTMRETLTGLLKHAGIEPADKYHETLTEAWVLAVHHFMNNTSGSNSADEFIDTNPDMLDSKIMMAHYSAELLFSVEARKKFVEPDRDSIPSHDE